MTNVRRQSRQTWISRNIDSMPFVVFCPLQVGQVSGVVQGSSVTGYSGTWHGGRCFPLGFLDDECAAAVATDVDRSPLGFDGLGGVLPQTIRTRDRCVGGSVHGMGVVDGRTGYRYLVLLLNHLANFSCKPPCCAVAEGAHCSPSPWLRRRLLGGMRLAGVRFPHISTQHPRFVLDGVYGCQCLSGCSAQLCEPWNCGEGGLGGDARGGLPESAGGPTRAIIFGCGGGI
jgi:hypothetical protein